MTDTVLRAPSILHGAGDAPARPLQQGAARLDASHAALSRKVGLGRVYGSPSGASWTLRPATAGRAAPADPLLLSTPEGPLEVGDGVRLLRILTGIDLDAAAPERGHYPDWLVAAVLGQLDATPLASVQGILPADDAAALPCALQLRLRQQQQVLDLTVRAASATWLALLDHPGWTALRAPLARWLPLPSTCTVVLARHRLPLAALRRLEAGDIILPAQTAFAINGSGTLPLAGRHWQVRYLPPGSIQLIAMEERLDSEHYEHGDWTGQPASAAAYETPVQDRQEAGGPEGAAETALEQLPLTLVFELGRISLPLAQLCALGPQTVLALGDGNPSAISITCGGRSMGSGEVVDVDGTLGIRITRWSSAS